MSAALFEMDMWLLALMALLIFGLAGWLVSLMKRDVSIVDSMWSLMFLIAATCYWALTENDSARAVLVVTLVAIWSVRLAVHIAWRNWGEGEDHRYQKIRENNSPNFNLKSIYIVFGLQAVLAWIISLPLLAAVNSTVALGPLDYVAVGLWFVGLTFEAVGDYQLAVFKAKPASNGQVLQSGLWKYTRHPNYFGDFCIWWAFYLFALSAGGWWAIISPLLMSLLLLKVSGVAMLERDISKRRPEYAAYIHRTNAFFPGPRKEVPPEADQEVPGHKNNGHEDKRHEESAVAR